MATRVKLPKIDCLRCGHNWTPEKEIVTVCPKCKSPYFDVPRKEKKDAGKSGR